MTAARLVEVIDVPVRLDIVVLPKLVIPDTYKLVEVTDVATVLTKTVEVANKLVEVALVKTAVDGVVPPIGVLLIVPPEMVRPSTTMASVILLLASEMEPEIFNVPTLAVVMLPVVIVELVIVVVVKVLVPVNELLLARYASEEVPASWLTDRPVTAAPADKLKAVATVSVPTFAVVMLPVVIVELFTVVVVNDVEPLKELVPVNELLPASVASVDVPLKLLNANPVIDDPVKLTVPFCTDRLVDVTEVIVPFVPASVVKKPLVEVTLVPVAVVKPNAPDNVPPTSGK